MRKAGILMPIASLPSDYGIGEFGSVCCQFADFLKKCGIHIWQILPLNPLGYGNSPYQPYSSYAGDELYISLERLYESGLLRKKPQPFDGDRGHVDYQAVRKYKENYLKKAFGNFVPDAEYEEFCSQDWVYPYAVFITFKKQNSLLCWNEWPEEYRSWIQNRAFDETVYEEEIRYEMFLQYTFFRQWMEVKSYVNEAGIQIMGDIPFYVGIDSLDVWANQEDFLIGADGQPTFIAGVPPDYFSADGQRWGNPIYNWEMLEKKHFSFWFDRLSYNSRLFDILRIDHFRAFDTYWKIPAKEKTAKVGEWVEAPGYRFFDELRASYPDMNLVVEDLGEMRNEVYELRDHFGFAGMKIVQFAFDPNEHNNDFNDRANLLIYTGTHDNQTIRGWYQSQDEVTRNGTRLYLYARGYQDPCISHCFIRYAFDSIADCAIIPVQDILGLGDEGRLNTPGTLGSPNWEWRLESLAPLFEQEEFLADCIESSGRGAASQFVPGPKEESLAEMLNGALEIRFGKRIENPSDAQTAEALLVMAEYLAARGRKS